MQEALSVDPDRELIATLRHQSLGRAGLVPLAGPAAGQNNAESIPAPAESLTRILDTELIAIYW